MLLIQGISIQIPTFFSRVTWAVPEVTLVPIVTWNSKVMLCPKTRGSGDKFKEANLMGSLLDPFYSIFFKKMLKEKKGVFFTTVAPTESSEFGTFN